MARWIVAVLIAGLALQTTGLLAVIAPDDCVVTLASQGSSSDTCPECVTCLCCPPLLPAAETPTVVLVPGGRVIARLAPAATPLPEPQPRDVLHVPRFA